jgi:hypothetical protein
MLIRLIEDGEYNYILKHERDGWLDEQLRIMREELDELPPESVDEIEAKKEEIKAFEKFAAKTKAKLEKYGPTIFRICSIKERDVIIAASRHNIPLTDRKNAGQNNIMSGILSHTEIQKLTAFEMGFRGYEHLRDMDGNEIPCNKDMIAKVKRSLPKDVKIELGGQIMGDISEEDEKN